MMKTAKGKRGAKTEKKEALKPVVQDRKRKALVKEDKGSNKRASKGKPGKDPNMPKRPATAFFVFLEEFRKTYKEQHPNVKGVAAVGKAGGQKWKSLSPAEKAPYEAKSAKRKTEYEKQMKAYNNKDGTTDGDDDNEVSDESKSDVSDEDEGGSEVVGEEEEDEEQEDDDEDDD